MFLDFSLVTLFELCLIRSMSRSSTLKLVAQVSACVGASCFGLPAFLGSGIAGNITTGILTKWAINGLSKIPFGGVDSSKIDTDDYLRMALARATARACKELDLDKQIREKTLSLTDLEPPYHAEIEDFLNRLSKDPVSAIEVDANNSSLKAFLEDPGPETFAPLEAIISEDYLPGLSNEVRSELVYSLYQRTVSLFWVEVISDEKSWRKYTSEVFKEFRGELNHLKRGQDDFKEGQESILEFLVKREEELEEIKGIPEQIVQIVELYQVRLEHKLDELISDQKGVRSSLLRIEDGRQENLVFQNRVISLLEDLARKTSREKYLENDEVGDNFENQTFQYFATDFNPRKFVGRETQILQVCEKMSRDPFVYVVGPGGSGKTWLALEVGNRREEDYPDGRWVMELGRIEDPNLVQREIGQKLGLSEKDGEMPIRDFFFNKKALLVLDNCEHLIDSVSEIILTLRGCPKLSILATSTKAFSITGERFSLSPMQIPEENVADPEVILSSSSVQLFVDSAKSCDSEFEFNSQNAPIISKICRKLEGMPLAIRIVSNKCSTCRLDEIFESISEILSTVGFRDTPERHRTVYAAVRWSYRLLSEVEQLVLRRLCVFRGGFTLSAVHEVCADGELTQNQVREILESLINNSMVIRSRGSMVSKSLPQRYRILDTIKNFGREELAEDEAVMLAESHRDWCIEFLKAPSHVLREGGKKGGEQGDALNEILVEHDNIRAAMDWCTERNDTENGLCLGASMWRFWENRGYYAEGLQELGALIDDGLDDCENYLVARAYMGNGMLAYRNGDYVVAEAGFKESLRRELEEKEIDKRRVAMCKSDLANVWTTSGRFEEALSVFEEALQEFIELEDFRQISVMKFNSARCLVFLQRWDEFDKIQKLLNESAKGFRKCGFDSDVGYPTTLEGWLLYSSGEYQAALKFFEKAYKFQLAHGFLPHQLNILEGVFWCSVATKKTRVLKSTLSKMLGVLDSVKRDFAKAQILDCFVLLGINKKKLAVSITHWHASQVLLGSSTLRYKFLKDELQFKLRGAFELEVGQGKMDESDWESSIEEGEYKGPDALLKEASKLFRLPTN